MHEEKLVVFSDSNTCNFRKTGIKVEDFDVKHGQVKLVLPRLERQPQDAAIS